MDKDVLLWIFGITFTVVGSLWLIIWNSVRTNIDEAHDDIREMKDRVSNIEGKLGGYRSMDDSIKGLIIRVTRIETKIELFWQSLGNRAADILHSSHTPELDVLLEAFGNKTIDDAGVKELIKRLENIEQSSEDKGYKISSAILLLIVKSNAELKKEENKDKTE
jgi:hypothetical protein